jgi:Na+/H+ antiporter NhaD/arsenite permease-like protein
LATGVMRFDSAVSLGRWGELHYESLLRDGTLILLTLLSVVLTRHSIRRANNFSYAAIREVAILFAAIFFTMIPATMLLGARGGELGLDTPAKYFWLSGMLSSFLDNAPTYVTFLAAAVGALGLHEVAQITQSTQGALILEAISVGSVFMGANTYIGNGPNFMVKAIAEQHGVKMPSFFGYVLYSGSILIPLFLLVTLIFF